MTYTLQGRKFPRESPQLNIPKLHSRAGTGKLNRDQYKWFSKRLVSSFLLKGKSWRLNDELLKLTDF